jgi:hypothetical protein
MTAEPKAEKKDGKSLIDIARAHFDAKREAITVPEWGGAVLYFTPVTYADMEALEGRNASATNLERNVLLLIAKALTKDGEQAFRWSDKHHLMTNVDGGIITRLTSQMMGIGLTDAIISEEDAVGKSEAEDPKETE